MTLQEHWDVTKQ